MRNMSFMLTTEQIRNRTKTVTRRIGWNFLKPGDQVMACKKCMGLKKGEKIEKITPIEILSIHEEQLFEITPEDVEREGFPGKSPEWFVKMFCEHNGASIYALVNRIEFEYRDV